VCGDRGRERNWESQVVQVLCLSFILPQTFHSVSDCLAYFSSHGLEELPNTQTDEDVHRLPRVTPVDPIESSWEDLPIDCHAKNSLSSKECDQQRAIWELIYTEHSLLRQLEVVINVFMRCLELIRRANILSEDGYHNVFGYMEEIYNAHVKFWSWTLQPCLEKVCLWNVQYLCSL